MYAIEIIVALNERVSDIDVWQDTGFWPTSHNVVTDQTKQLKALARRKALLQSAFSPVNAHHFDTPPEVGRLR